MEGEQEGATEIEGMTHQPVPLPGEEALVAALRFLYPFPMPLPLAQAEELLEVPRRPQEQARSEDLHPVEEEADPSVDAVEGDVRERAHVKEHRGRGGGGVEREEEPVVRPEPVLAHHASGPPLVRFRHGHAVEERERAPRDDHLHRYHQAMLHPRRHQPPIVLLGRRYGRRGII